MSVEQALAVGFILGMAFGHFVTWVFSKDNQDEEL